MKLNRQAIDLRRARQCISIAMLARRAGISASSINNGYKKGVTAVVAGKIARALEVDPEEIILKEE